MPVVVQKYGGSSVGTVEKMRKVAEKVAAARRAGKDVCVVVSAMGDTTDDLLALAKQISPAPARRELDMLLSAGERISMALLSMALNDLGVPAISFTGSQSGIITTDSHSAARILEVRAFRVQEELAKGKVVIVAGYQGVSTRKEVTTLGRGGSDTTAVALAAALGADCEIYSDVAGVFTADPRVVPSAARLDALSYEEMQELAAAGAKVLNAQAVEFAKERGIAIHARSTFGGPEETVVKGGAHPERIAGVAVQKGLALLGFPAARLGDVLGILERHGAVALEIAAPGERAGVALDLENVHDWPVLRAQLAAEVPGLAAEDEAIGAVSVVGTGISAGHRVLRAVAATLAELGARPRALFTSPLRVTAYCDAAVLKDAARRLHEQLVG
ncbi:aspartate kinase [Anaeromyxobacter dehalogenans 2CP-1]|uniref:Aspartokinase n=1 Tax=Anaeromyxobacter dehalogenans (strain ATCC BAA-258 / DSM 21875 / 2CP-1) TaxID=455488 RepID=B8J6T3_ANAD2|nr:aspartate kinase [Anaeromyxobacter dehalogenans]ACL67055.1 aspartate kinase [Anaeromyxobacter dehalogenans 2CP-1]